MPILVTTPPAPPPPSTDETPPPAPAPSPSVPAAVPKAVSWTSPRGDVIPLTDWARGWGQEWGRSGLGVAPVEVRTDELAVGARFRGQRRLPRTLAWSQLVFGVDQADFDARLRALALAFHHDLGSSWVPGRLTVQHFDGRSRYVDGFYLDGLEGAEEQSSWGMTWARLPIRVQADPFWAATDEVVVSARAASVDRPFYGDTFYPLSLGSSQVLGDFDVVNPGDVDAAPVITVTGPGTAPVVRNVTTGKTLTFTRALLAGQQVVVDVAAGTILGPGGSWRPHISFPGSALWSLVPGRNDLAVSMTGTSAASAVEVRFRPLHLLP